MLLVYTAFGETLTPMIVYPYVKPPKSLLAQINPDWTLGLSKSVWMRADLESDFDLIYSDTTPNFNENFGLVKSKLLQMLHEKAEQTSNVSQALTAIVELSTGTSMGKPGPSSSGKTMDRGVQKSKKKTKQYSPSKMALAIRACNTGTLLRTAATKYGVPRSTLRNKVKGISPEIASHQDLTQP
ncbi:hypothetical protein M8J77_021867 [Diaphorina citri]|nr:hypothetical protein M8J77_021867 [Diaphorina citri]